MLSWFGAIRMKRKPLRYEEQRHLVRFHTHQNQSQYFIEGPHSVKLPVEEQVPAIAVCPLTSTDDADKSLPLSDSVQNDPNRPLSANNIAASSGGVGIVPVSADHPSMQQPGGGIPGGNGQGEQQSIPQPYPMGMRPQMMNQPSQQYLRPDQYRMMQLRLKQIRDAQINSGQTNMGVPPPPILLYSRLFLGSTGLVDCVPA